MLQFTKVYKQRRVRRRRFARNGPVFMTWDSIFTIDVQVVVTAEFKNQIHIAMDLAELLDEPHLCVHIHPLVACVRPQCIVVVTQGELGVSAL